MYDGNIGIYVLGAEIKAATAEAALTSTTFGAIIIAQNGSSSNNVRLICLPHTHTLKNVDHM